MWDSLEPDRACAALSLLSGDIDVREAIRRLMDTGLDEAEALEWLNAAAVERIG